MSDETTPQPEVSVLPDTFSLDVDVTTEDIAKGLRDDARDCPFARALDRALIASQPKLAETHEPQVLYEKAKLLPRRTGPGYGANLPDIARDFIRRFDARPQQGSFEPFSVHLDFAKG